MSGQSGITFDRQVFQFSNVAASGGTAVVTIPTNAAPYTDKVIRLMARVYTTSAASSHLVNAFAGIVEYVVENKNNTTTAAPALSTSSNPINSNTTGFALTSRVETGDTPVSTSTAVWTLVSSEATLTVTNNAASGSVAVNVTVVVDIEYVGSVSVP
jgi:hypothetical protein